MSYNDAIQLLCVVAYLWKTPAYGCEHEVQFVLFVWIYSFFQYLCQSVIVM